MTNPSESRSDRWWVGVAFVLLLLAILLPRISMLGTMLTNDEPIWQGRAHQFITGIATLRPSLTFGGGQPGVTTMWVAGLADRFNSLAASQLSVALMTSLLIVIATALLVRIAGIATGFLAGFFLALDNFFIAHSRVVHTDAFLALGIVITLLLLALVWKTRASRYLVLAGISTSFAILSKLMGTLLLLPALATLIFSPGTRPLMKRFRAYGLTLFLISILAWPALYSPVGPIRYMAQRLTLHSQETDFGKGGNDPLYYPREWYFRLSPISTVAAGIGLLGAIVGTGAVLPRLSARRFWLAFPATIAVFGLIMSFGGQRSDRYFLMGNLAVDLLAAAGVVWAVAVFGRIVPVMNRRILLGSSIFLVIAWLAADTARIHPYYLAHYNRLYPITMDKKLGWGEGLERASAWLSEHSDPQTTRAVTYYASVLGKWHGWTYAESLGHEYDENPSQYVVLYRAMFGRELDSKETQYLNGYFRRGHCRHDIVINDLPYVWIFDRLPEDRSPGSGDIVSSHKDLLPLPSCETTEILAS